MDIDDQNTFPNVIQENFDFRNIDLLANDLNQVEVNILHNDFFTQNNRILKKFNEIEISLKEIQEAENDLIWIQNDLDSRIDDQMEYFFLYVYFSKTKKS